VIELPGFLTYKIARGKGAMLDGARPFVFSHRVRSMERSRRMRSPPSIVQKALSASFSSKEITICADTREVDQHGDEIPEDDRARCDQ
jgi:hypothetical protein